MLKLFEQYEYLQFIWHYIHVVEKIGTFLVHQAETSPSRYRLLHTQMSTISYKATSAFSSLDLIKGLLPKAVKSTYAKTVSLDRPALATK